MITQSSPVGDRGRPSVVGRVRRWSVWSLPRPALGYILTVELLTVVLTTVAIAHTHLTSTDLGRFTLLAGLAIVYAEAADRIEQSKRYLNHQRIWSNHTSVWAFAGALLLPAGYAGMLVVLVYAQHVHMDIGTNPSDRTEPCSPPRRWCLPRSPLQACFRSSTAVCWAAA